ncbi:MAG: DUF3298 domain-containing protein [Mailhella sp.]|nr:DUF3298 domain-containing protein [Mailhella sp.]
MIPFFLSFLLLFAPLSASGTEQSDIPSARYALTIPHGHIKASWQKTGLKEADDFAEAKVKEEAEQFKARVEALDEESQPMGMAMPECELSVTAAVSAGGKTIGVLWATYEYLGGGHGSLGLESRIYFQQNSSKDQNVRLLGLKDLFRDPRAAIEIFSEFSREELTRRGLDPSMVEAGTVPVPENFLVFLLDDDGILLFFEPYQVAPWADGTIRLHIPLDRLKKASPKLSYWK